MSFSLSNIRILVICLLQLTACCGFVRANSTINFNEFASDNTTSLEYYFTSGEFSFSCLLIHSIDGCFVVHGRNGPLQADPGFATVAVASYAGSMAVSRLDGGLFNLKSVDFADWYNAGRPFGPTTVRVYMTKPLVGELAPVSVVLDDFPGLETISLNAEGLSSVRFYSPDQYIFQVDNITLASAVPENGRPFLFLGGLLALGASLRLRWALFGPLSRT